MNHPPGLPYPAGTLISVTVTYRGSERPAYLLETDTLGTWLGFGCDPSSTVQEMLRAMAGATPLLPLGRLAPQ